jgi:hypothetical protein
MTDLWPTDIGAAEFRAPVTILKEQASLLGQKTQQIVSASVASSRGGTIAHSSKTVKQKALEYDFRHDFYIVAPAIANYRYRLFTIMHNIEPYPCVFLLDEDLLRELGFWMDGKTVTVTAADEEQFIFALARIFKAEKTRRVIAALLAQSEGYTSDDTSSYR